ncbi:MAG: diguanylate cyclase [Tepidanaerobacteraceae bacterium]|jgi:diguanylate cyclase (GGDEF)-like protein|nr:diguanylate cyclase [Tepidanaerobacteraceae bacterium]
MAANAMKQASMMESFKKIPYRYWMIIAFCIFIPIARENYFPDIFIDEIWNLYIIPVIIFSYYDGFRGAILSGTLCDLIFIIIEIKGIIADKKFPVDFGQMFSFLFVIAGISMSIGYLTERLREKERRLKALNERLMELALIDPLTGLYNRRYIQQRLHDEISRASRKGYSVSFLMIDGDNFKEINDTLGHPTGDEELQNLAETLHTCVRQSDIVARYGGDEFCVILPDTDKKAAQEVATRLCEASRDSRLSISIGYASYPEDADNGDELVKIADMALLEAKKEGKNRAVSFKNENAS